MDWRVMSWDKSEPDRDDLPRALLALSVLKDGNVTVISKTLFLCVCPLLKCLSLITLPFKPVFAESFQLAP